MSTNLKSVILDSKDLLHALNFAASVIDKRNVITELGHIKLAASENQLKIIATDMDIYLSQVISAQTFTSWETTVSIQTFSDIVRKIDNPEITLNFQENAPELEIIAGNFSCALPVLPANQFHAAIQDNSNSFVVTTSCKGFAKIMEQTQFAMSTEETRYNLNGIYLHSKDTTLYAAATDAHRLALSTTDIKESPSQEMSVILPRKTVNEIFKIVKDTSNINNALEMTVSRNKIKFSCNNIEMISKLVDATFPDYRTFIPTDSDATLTINPKLLANTIDRVATVTLDKFRAIKLIIEQTKLEIFACGEAKGSAKEILHNSEESYHFTGADISIGFNPKYILDALGTIKNDKIECCFNGTENPMIIKIPENEGSLFVVMPVKI